MELSTLRKDSMEGRPQGSGNSDEDLYTLGIPGRQRDPSFGRRKRLSIVTALLFLLLGAPLVVIATLVATRSRSAGPRLVSRIAFGSCTSYDDRPVPAWQGVVSQDPDAWIWAGDMAYLDTPDTDCTLLPEIELSEAQDAQCDCETTWMRAPDHQCFAGDLDHAARKMGRMLASPDYRAFLEHFCPGYLSSGQYPPPGEDRAVCPRPVLGTYDDHDFGWNDGNRRLPGKSDMKQIFLDALGVPADSPRRNSGRGIESLVTLNAGVSGREIDVWLLDERFYRAPLPCGMRRAYCEELLAEATAMGLDAYDAVKPKHRQHRVWCDDFLHGGDLGAGSCCDVEDALEEVCADGDPSDADWAATCDPTAPGFASLNLRPGEGGVLRPPDPRDPGEQREPEPFCSMLGPTQRAWFQSTLTASAARLKLVVSGSVLLGNVPMPDDPPNNKTCSGDEWGCYPTAQRDMLQLLAVAEGCTVVLTGDWHFGDLKRLEPGAEPPYAGVLGTDGLSRPLFQLMASGLTTSTAKYGALEEPCSSFREDGTTMRLFGRCGATYDPNFGLVTVDWARRRVELALRAADGSQAVAHDDPSVALSVTLDLDTCLPLEA